MVVLIETRFSFAPNGSSILYSGACFAAPNVSTGAAQDFRPRTAPSGRGSTCNTYHAAVLLALRHVQFQSVVWGRWWGGRERCFSPPCGFLDNPAFGQTQLGFSDTPGLSGSIQKKTGHLAYVGCTDWVLFNRPCKMTRYLFVQPSERQPHLSLLLFHIIMSHILCI